MVKHNKICIYNRIIQKQVGKIFNANLLFQRLNLKIWQTLIGDNQIIVTNIYVSLISNTAEIVRNGFFSIKVNPE